MPLTNLIIALVFAALFGAGLVCLALYFIHSYIRKRCLELDHWFRLLLPKQLRSPCRHCEGTGRDLEEKSRSRSSQRNSRSRSRAKRGRSRHERGGKRLTEAETEWNALGAKEGQLRGGGQEGLQRPALPAAPSAQSPGVTEHYDPWQASSPQQYAQPAMYPQAYSQIPQQPYPQSAPQFESHTMPAPLLFPQAQHVPSSASSMPVYQKPPRQSRTGRPKRSSRSRSRRQVSRDGIRVRTTDFIHIVDDYPPIVKEAIRKAAQNQEPVLSTTMSSTDSSTSTEPIEEVPRVSIPQATPRFADPAPFPLPQYPDLATRAWNVPTTFPPQWNRNGPVEQVRYATPYTRPGVWVSSPKEMRVPRHDPSNTLPGRNSSEPMQWSRVERRESMTRTLRRSRRTRPEDKQERYVRSGHGAEADVQEQAEASDHPQSSTSSSDAGGCKAKSTEQRASSHRGVPLMSPMPVPIVEEPLSDYDSANMREKVNDSSSSAAKSQTRPSASAVRSPSAHV